MGGAFWSPSATSKAIGSEISNLLADDARRRSISERAYAASRSMTWARSAESYLRAFEAAQQSAGAARSRLTDSIAALRGERPLPEIRVGHFLSLCDETGMLQHSVFSVADRSHGYCVDDNARALLFSTAPLPARVSQSRSR